MVACSGPGSAPAAQGLGTTPGTPQESPQPKEMRLARVLPKSRKQVSWRQGFRAEPRDRSVRFPSTKTPLLVLSWGLLLLQSTPESGRERTNPAPRGVWLQARQVLEWPAPRERHNSGPLSPSPVQAARPPLAARDPLT